MLMALKALMTRGHCKRILMNYTDWFRRQLGNQLLRL